MRHVFLLCIVFICFNAAGQQKYKLQVNITGVDKKTLNALAHETSVADNYGLAHVAKTVVSQLQFNGYFLADTIATKFNAAGVSTINVDAGVPFKWVNLSSGNLPEVLKQNIGFKRQFYEHAIFSVTALQNTFKAILSYYENNGYPFASVSLDSVKLDSNAVSATIKIAQNHKIVYDSIEFVGSAKVAQKYLQTYLNTKQFLPYAEQSVAKVESRLRELKFLTVVKPPEVSFTAEKAIIKVYADKKNANQFDGVLGLQQDAFSGKMQLVGNLRLDLQNTFKMGEGLSFNYQGLANASQLLDIKAVLPNVLGTSFGLQPSLYIYKQDTSFVNVNTKLGFNYLLSGNNGFQFFVENRSTSLVAVNGFLNATTLPQVLDVNTLFYGVEANIERLDYRLNPQKGFSVNFNFSVGNKKILRNASLPAQLYDQLALVSTSYRFFSELKYFLPLKERLVLALTNQNGFVAAKHLVDNELFRLGGQNNLRGFNELSILANNYVLANAEIRYLLAQHSYLAAFYNQAYVNYATSGQENIYFPYGFGATINTETEMGILSLSYALGKQKNNLLNLRQGKIHIGFTALF